MCLYLRCCPWLLVPDIETKLAWPGYTLWYTICSLVVGSGGERCVCMCVIALWLSVLDI